MCHPGSLSTWPALGLLLMDEVVTRDEPQTGQLRANDCV